VQRLLLLLLLVPFLPFHHSLQLRHPHLLRPLVQRKRPQATWWQLHPQELGLRLLLLLLLSLLLA